MHIDNRYVVQTQVHSFVVCHKPQRYAGVQRRPQASWVGAADAPDRAVAVLGGSFNSSKRHPDILKTSTGQVGRTHIRPACRRTVADNIISIQVDVR